MSYWHDRATNERLQEFLEGQVVHAIYMSPEEHAMAFEINQGEDYIVLWTEGDCCSESWWADLMGVQNLLGREITKAVVIRMDDLGTSYNTEDGRGRQEDDVAYGYEFLTEHGMMVGIFRNSSNGYYGGECYLFKTSALDKDVPGVWTDEPWREITGDWSA